MEVSLHSLKDFDPQSYIKCNVIRFYLCLFSGENEYKIEISRFDWQVTINSVIYDVSDMTFGYFDSLFAMATEFIDVCTDLECYTGDYLVSQQEQQTKRLTELYRELLIELNYKWLKHISLQEPRWLTTKCCRSE